jgi:hypothetical protein
MLRRLFLIPIVLCSCDSRPEAPPPTVVYIVESDGEGPIRVTDRPGDANPQSLDEHKLIVRVRLGTNNFCDLKKLPQHYVPDAQFADGTPIAITNLHSGAEFALSILSEDDQGHLNLKLTRLLPGKSRAAATTRESRG